MLRHPLFLFIVLQSILKLHTIFFLLSLTLMALQPLSFFLYTGFDAFCTFLSKLDNVEISCYQLIIKLLL